MSRALPKQTSGFKDATPDSFADVRRACSEWLYRSCDNYRQSVAISKARAQKQNENRRARA